MWKHYCEPYAVNIELQRKHQMNVKLVSVLMGSIMLATPLTSTVARAQATPLAQLFPALSGISLTEEQQTQLEQLKQQTLPQVKNVLTPEQQTKFQTALEEGQGVRVALLSLELSAQQQQQLRSIFQSAKSQITKTLTPQQQRQIMQNVWSRKQQGF